MGQIVVRQLRKSFQHNEILKGVTTEIRDGSFTILLGPSGCGKTTLLRLIAGLEESSGGQIFIEDRDITFAEPKERNIAMVFQNYALYPHMTVYGNIEYGLRVQKMPKPQREELIRSVLDLVELTDHTDKRPSQLSGGQRQRVALARAIVKRPQVFLMDEPLSNLDAKLRSQMRQELVDLHKKLKTTFLYVTHDQVEAMAMGTYIIIMNQGEIMQQGTPKEIYTNPANLFVAEFIGSPPTNILSVDEGYLGIRPEDMHLSEQRTAEHDASIPGKLKATEHLGAETIYRLQTEYGMVNVKARNNWQEIREEEEIFFSCDNVMLFNRQGDRLRKKEELPGALARLKREWTATI